VSEITFSGRDDSWRELASETPKWGPGEEGEQGKDEISLWAKEWLLWEASRVNR